MEMISIQPCLLYTTTDKNTLFSSASTLLIKGESTANKGGKVLGNEN